MKRRRVLRYRILAEAPVVKPTIAASILGGYLLRFPGSPVMLREPTFDEALAAVRRWYKIGSYPAAGA